MITEVVALSALVLAGWLVARATDASPGLAVCSALPLGAAIYVGVTLALLATQSGLANPVIALPTTLVVAAMAWLRHTPTMRVARPRAAAAAMLVVGGVALVRAMLSASGLVSVSADSFRYLTVAGLLDLTGSTRLGSAFLFESRGVAVGALHAMASDEAAFLHALTPLFFISLLGVLWTSVLQVGALHRRWPAMVVATGAVLVLAVNERVLFHAFYLNGHLFVAGWLLLLQIQVIQLRAGRALRSAGLDLLLTGSLVAAVVTARPEGALLAALVLAPAVLDRTVPATTRRALLGSLAVPLLAWQGLVLGGAHVTRGTAVPASVLGVLMLALAALVLVPFVPTIDRFLPRRHPLLWLHGLAWAAVAAFSVRDPGTLYYSVRATWRNVLLDGGWGTSLVILAIIAVTVVALVRFTGAGSLAFTLGTFIPLSLLLAFLRDGAYRIGPGDSLNRMLLHVLPIAVLGIALAAFGEQRLQGRPRISPKSTRSA